MKNQYKFIPCRYKDDEGKIQYKQTMVDAEIYDFLVNMSPKGYWYYNKSKTSGYIYIKPTDSNSIYMHNVVYEKYNGKIPKPLPGEKKLEIGHEDDDKLNNTIENLKLITHKENQEKRKMKNDKLGRWLKK